MRCDTDRIGKLAHLLWLNLKLHLLLEDIGSDRHCFGGYHTTSPLQHHRNILATISPRLQGNVDLRRVVHKRYSGRLYRSNTNIPIRPWRADANSDHPDTSLTQVPQASVRTMVCSITEQ